MCSWLDSWLDEIGGDGLSKTTSSLSIANTLTDGVAIANSALALAYGFTTGGAVFDAALAYGFTTDEAIFGAAIFGAATAGVAVAGTTLAYGFTWHNSLSWYNIGILIYNKSSILSWILFEGI